MLRTTPHRSASPGRVETGYIHVILREYHDWMVPKITVHPHHLTEDTAVLLHFGDGGERAVLAVSQLVIDRHDHWVGVIDGCGRFAVSAYVLAGIDEDVIAREMPHRVYGRSTVGEVRSAGFG